MHEQDHTVELTPLGRAFVRALNAQSAEVATDGFVNLVLSEDDPTAIARVFARIAQVGKGMLVDPYLRFEPIITLAIDTSINRALTSKKLKKEELDAIRVGLPRLYPDAVFEVRVGPKTLHDRFLIPSQGYVQAIGTSLTGVGRSLTIMGELRDVTEALRQKYEEIWTNAEVLAVSGSDQPESDATRGSK